jgi:hypothetical protein
MWPAALNMLRCLCGRQAMTKPTNHLYHSLPTISIHSIIRSLARDATLVSLPSLSFHHSLWHFSPYHLYHSIILSLPSLSFYHSLPTISIILSLPSLSFSPYHLYHSIIHDNNPLSTISIILSVVTASYTVIPRTVWTAVTAENGMYCRLRLKMPAQLCFLWGLKIASLNKMS